MTNQPGSSHSPHLKPIHLQVLCDLASGSTVTAAAAAAGLHRTTVHYWCRVHPSFALALRNACLERMSRMQEDMVTLAPSALDVLRTTLTDPQVSPSVRLRAALAVIAQVTSYGVDASIGEGQSLTENTLPLELAPHPQPEPHPESQPEPQQPEPPQAQQPATRPEHSPATRPHTPLNQKCPCGSGRKFKKCCLHRLAARSAP